MQSEAKKILELIENVDPEDTRTLNEIDSRVWCMMHPKWDYETRFSENPFSGGYASLNGDGICLEFIPQPTRSRDALKSIRPKWTDFSCRVFEGVADCYLTNLAPKREYQVKSVYGGLPTEELAELHAIIQAIEWERNNAK